MWDCYELNPARSRRFARSMNLLVQKPGFSLDYLVSGFDWSQFSDGSKIVDMGGSHGHASLAVLEAYPRLEFIVQDLPDVISSLDEEIVSFNPNIRFEVHDFLQSQRTPADLYLLRWILHDWPDSYVMKILKNLTSTLRPGNKILINDSVMPKLGQTPWRWNGN